ncbi:hypothetical protein [Rugamonas rivuli]|uniref:Uncharacterized protein n=1 Tax=Rugamonas rivuli TaxID=2743358 RepID=A0A843S211_9BURK|nr:hypothetical protein [Rugamonas rivuli]MQA18139.1 hypothetical protein [Rugamonas rivuli]
MKKSTLLIILFTFSSSGCIAEEKTATTKVAPVKHQKCTTTPCPNTPNGEDPEQITLREGAKMTAELRNDPDDQLRWSAVALYSDSKHAERLKMAVVKKFETEIQLVPQNGFVIFSGPHYKQTFKIASPLGTASNPCSKYNIRIVQAGADYAILKKICPLNEYAPNRYHMSADYYLFDQKTATARSVWSASVTNKESDFPDADPEVTIKKIDNGYRFDWTGLFPSDGKPTKQTIHNVYTYIPSGKIGAGLLCRDATRPKSEGAESDMCEGGFLDLISSTK